MSERVQRPPADFTYLSPIDAHEVLGRALLSQLWQKFGALLEERPQDIAALRAIPSGALEARGSIASELAYVADKYSPYRWDRFEARQDDGDEVIKPLDVDADLGGRWVKSPFFDYPGRYYCHVFQHAQMIHNSVPLDGQAHMPSLMSLCSGKTPALFLCYLGKAAQQMRDQQPGKIADDRFDYRIKVVTKNWRGEPAARFGSPVDDESWEPGSAELLGRIEWFLRKHADGLSDTMGVGVIQIGQVRSEASWGTDMRVMDTMDITIQATTEVFNEPQEVVQISRFIVQTQQRLDDGTLVPIDQPSMVGE